MTCPSSPVNSSGDNEESIEISEPQHNGDEDMDSIEKMGILTEDASATKALPTRPARAMQKRRRVTRACDECRRKKIKCDGKQPCTHCTVYSYGKGLPPDERG
jgi:Fungal Zn(2)-Cys(6) binuclear cluster domain